MEHAGDQKQPGQSPPAASSLLDQWRYAYLNRERGDLVDLPSGIQARVSRMSLPALMSSGMIPDALTTIARDLIAVAEQSLEIGAPSIEEVVGKESEADPVETYNRYIKIINFVCVSCMNEPRMTYRGEVFYPTPDQDFPVYVDDMDERDRMFVYMYCQGVDQTVQEFLHEQALALGDVPDLQDVPDPPEDVPGDERQRLVVLSGGQGGLDVGNLRRIQHQGNQGSNRPEEV